MFESRDYQQKAIAEVEDAYQAGHKRILLAMPTGSGKTYTASQIIRKHAEQDGHSLFIVDRIELVHQAANTLHRMGLQVGILQGENTDQRPTDQVTVASIQTIRSRGIGFAHFIVIDECHILHRAHIEVMKNLFWIPVLGLSATPLRPDLGQHFTALVRGPAVRDLMHSGDLVGKVHAYAPSHDAMRRILDGVATRGGDFIEGELSRALNRKELFGDIVSTWQGKAADRQTLCFAVDIAHSRAITEDFREAGIEAEHLDAYTPEVERHRIISAFRDHKVQLLSSVNVLGIGFDVPTASCGIMARPTLSEMLHMQQIGRLLRPAPGKGDALILDHAGNTLRFGLPQDFTVPDLNAEDHTSTKDKRKLQKMVVCHECGYVLEPDQITCPACGLDRQRRKADVHYLDGSLVKFGDDGDGLEQYTLAQKQAWFLAMLWHARRRNRRDGWASYAWKAKFNTEQWPAWGWRDMSPVMPDDEQSRWLKYYEIRQAKSLQKSKPGRPVQSCRKCGSSDVHRIPGAGPHAAGLRCNDCGQHLGWISKQEATNA